MEININFAAILVCGLAFMVLGAFWYSPLLFGRIWMRSKAMGPPILSFWAVQRLYPDYSSRHGCRLVVEGAGPDF